MSARLVSAVVLALVVRPLDGGALPVDPINRVIRANAAAFRLCYQRELAKDPKIEGGGKVVLAVEIDKTGAASTQIHSTTLNNANVESCLVREMQKLKFPPNAPGKFKYPLLFSGGR